MSNRRYMFEAIELAKKGRGWVSPNPPVGCVIVADGKIVGRGWHENYGGPHAEVNALREAGVRAKDAEAYVTLMPCNHFGKTPPCTHALVNAGIKKVFVAVDDPDPTSGDGIAFLEKSGVEVHIGLLQANAEKVMHGFLKFIRCALPHITLKYAMTLDGCIATSTGDSKWISSEMSRDYVQTLRAQADAVMVGSNTLLLDDPRLNVRDCTAAQPFRIVVDSKLQIPVNSTVFKTPGSKVIVITSENISADKVVAIQKAGAEVLAVPLVSGKIDLTVALSRLAQEYGVRDILCEGGGGLAGALCRAKLVDKVIAFIAPKILGGKGVSPTEGGDLQVMSEAVALSDFETTMLGDDVVCTGWM